MILVVGVLLVSFGMLVLTTAAVASSSGFNLVQATALGLIVGGYGVSMDCLVDFKRRNVPCATTWKVMALGLVSQNIFLLLTNLFFLVALEYTPSMDLCTFLIMNVLTAVFLLLFLRETKEKPLKKYRRSQHAIPQGLKLRRLTLEQADGEYTCISRRGLTHFFLKYHL